MIIGIDPGNFRSAYVVLPDDLSEVGVCRKEDNEVALANLSDIINELKRIKNEKVYIAIEMIGHYGTGMPAGKDVFDTCVWIGRFTQLFTDLGCVNIDYIMRKEEKINICGSMKANDSTIKQALVDRFAPYTPNKGKGTKKEPGYFYGFSADM